MTRGQGRIFTSHGKIIIFAWLIVLFGVASMTIKKRDEMATISQTAVGNTGNRSVSRSSSPGSASVRNSVSAVSMGQPGQPGVGITPQSTSGHSGMGPMPPGVQTQVTPGGTTTGAAGGQGTGLQIARPDMATIQSYVDQFRSGALNPNQFATQLRQALMSAREGARADAGQASRAVEGDALARVRSGLSQARQTAQGVATRAGVTLPQGWDSPISAAEQWIIDRESSGSPTAENPSGAFGLGQLMPFNRERFAAQLGISNPDTTDPQEQLAMMRAYIAERYGTPEAAVEFWRQNGWY